MSDWRDQEIENEIIFREINEWTEEANGARGRIEHRVDVYLCECSDRQCTEPIRLTRREYEAVRAVPVRFAIALNHENPEVDWVVCENKRYAVVDKFYGPAAKVAWASNPRR